MAVDHSRLGLENKSGRTFLLSTNLLYKILRTNLGVCKPTIYTFYTSHLRWNSTMRRCIYHTDLGPPECSISQFFKINCPHSIFRTINRGLVAKPFKKFPKSPIRPAGSHFWQAPNLEWELCWVFEWTLKEVRFNVINNVLFIFFI